jgi:hypothetical protein
MRASSSSGRPSGHFPYVSSPEALCETCTNQLRVIQVSIGVYPFMFGTIKDFQPIFEELVSVCLETLRIVQGKELG